MDMFLNTVFFSVNTLFILVLILYWLIYRVCQSLSLVQLFATPWIVGHQAPLSMEFSSQEYWIGLLFPSPGDPPNPGIKPGSPALQMDALPSELQRKPSLLQLCNKFDVCSVNLPTLFFLLIIGLVILGICASV